MKWAVKENLEKEWCFMMSEEKLAPLAPTQKEVPTGLRLHLLDIWVDELAKVGGVEEKEFEEKREVLLGPVEKMKKEGGQKWWKKRAEETLVDDRVRLWRGEIDENEEKEGEGDDIEDEDASESDE